MASLHAFARVSPAFAARGGARRAATCTPLRQERDHPKFLETLDALA